MRLAEQIFQATFFVVAALLPIVNPLGSALIFLGFTRGYSALVRRALVWRISFNSLLLLVGSIVVGSHVLAFFGVSLPVVQIGGGLVIVSMGWQMLQEKDDPAALAAAPSAEDAGERAFYPLTLPVTIGPGSISIAVALGANIHKHAYAWPAVLAGIFLGPVLVAMSVYICYRSAERLEKLLGRTGLSVFVRLSAFLVLCIGIQLLWNGVNALTHAR